MKKLATGVAYLDEGSGDDVVLLLHGSFSADWFVPVGRRLAEDGYRVVLMHRPGYGQSGDLGSDVGVPVQIGEAVNVLAAAGVRQAHVVGHSSGCAVALQLALDHQELVRSLVLLEPAFPPAPDEPKNPAMPHAIAAAREGDFAGAFDRFLGGVSGAGFRDVFVRELGQSGLDRAVASSRFFFTTEAAAFGAWSCGPAEAAAVTAPVLLVVGGEGERLNTPHRARSAQLAAWLPHAEIRVLPGVSHAMPLEDPPLVAATIEQFVAGEEK